MGVGDLPSQAKFEGVKKAPLLDHQPGGVFVYEKSGLSKPLPTETTKSKAKGSKEITITEHLLTLDQVCSRHSTSANSHQPGQSRGLDTESAAQRLKENGPNILTPPKKKHWIFSYLEHLGSLFNLLLILAGVLDFILLGIDPEGNHANIYLGAILIAVAFLNAFIEFYQLQKSQKILESFLNMIPQKCHVIREGRLAQISAADLVLGDVVYVNQGDKVPADLYIFASNELKVDNSSLTGESEPQSRFPGNEASNCLEATNLVFNGTLAVGGEGYGIVICTGDNTVLGQIAGLTAGEEKNPSPLSVEIDHFVKIIAAIAILTAIIFFVLCIAMYGKASFAINFAIGIFVAWVPQGLMATVTMLLTIAAKRLTKHNVLVKDLQGVETLGAITLLATDKTGTLTRNQMTVTNIWTGLRLYTTTRNNLDRGESISLDGPGILEILHISSLCAKAKFDRTDIPIEKRQILGDATESGLVRFVAQTLPDFDELADHYPKAFEIPFNSENKWHMTIHQKAHPTGKLTLYIKGAPERVLRLCSTILVDGHAIPMTDHHRDQFQLTYEYMAGLGHRVLAFAQLLLPGDQYPANFPFRREGKQYPTENFCFVGLASLEDPPKHGVREAIGRCRVAGIQVMMVTGDHPLTAEAIGRKINLMISETKAQVAQRTGVLIDSVQEHEYSAIVIHGESIDSLTDRDWDLIFSKSEIIFARTSPKHKLEIVKRAQAMGHIVGVTGDGVNDSPALKKADLGIAMNQSGSDVSKEAAAMILLDDNFASIVKGIEEGRLIFTNLKKSIQYTVTHSTPEVIPNLLYIIVPLPLPISAILVLAIDLGFELFIALTFAWEPPESESSLMKLPPRRPVTFESLTRFRARMARRPQPAVDPETGEPIEPTLVRRVLTTLGRPFTRNFWLDFFEKQDGEVLVDGNLLSWAYLEVGTIEAVACTTTYLLVLYKFGITPAIARLMAKDGIYFTETSPVYENAEANLHLTGAEQYRALGEAQSAFYLSVMITQIFNLFACKTRLRLPLGRIVLRNRATFIGIFGGVALAMLVVYVPPFNYVFLSNYHLSPIYWLVPMAFGFVIIIYACLRMLVLRYIRPIKWSPEISGLQMYPTVWSQRSANRAI
ncbi:hypothetical protein BJ085DRAFT_21450 [Dimargaris cristalligena]|uniref:Cation-transporting P-type ATPase N-terminal domain-containing protein n=1 Tax=Dimargaris cristalligena TaxID=215637 RepID=A0A4P9ZM46_9FUNG|nr:hypothetical protein BJ085DRAFT_21450 [Dimargaris cristalligena]|eukprot:RKP34367.1 hypothetical protein BJ085DRAFT_21450 [Dimargaris cristalligena]